MAQDQADVKFRFAAGMTQNVWDFADLVLKTRFAQALQEGAARYPVYRDLRFAARVELEALFDDLASNACWKALRLDAGSMILDGPDVYIVAHGGRKSDYCSCIFGIWAASAGAAQAARDTILGSAGPERITDPMFSIDWHFLTSRGELESASIEEMANDVLFDSAYPEIAGGVRGFIANYLDAGETVLVLQGPPGTGKTRLIRAILGEISRRHTGHAQALYTGDKKAMESDEIFVRFITGWEDAFVVEDADHLLTPRAEGNENLHRFLTIADGVVRAQGRKIIFSTNLPNLGDLDDALIRPGRCFARVYLRALSANEAQRLLADLCGTDNTRCARAFAKLTEAPHKSYSLADVYRAYGAILLK